MSRWLRRRRTPAALFVEEAWQSYTYLPGLMGELSRQLIRRSLLSGLGWSRLAITTSTVTERALRGSYGASRTAVLHDGLDCSGIDRSDAARPAVFTYDFITVGRQVRIKRVRDFVIALSRLREQFGWSGKAVVVGKGPELGSLKELVTNLGLARQIDVTGHVSDTALSSLLRSSKVFVLCSEREGFSQATLLALAWGLPAIVARPRFEEVFGVSDLVSDGLNGSYFSVGDTDALAQQMYQLLGSEETYRRMSAQARLVGTDSDWSYQAEKLEALLLALSAT